MRSSPRRHACNIATARRTVNTIVYMRATLQKPPAKGMEGMEGMEDSTVLPGLTARAFAGWIVKTALAVRVRILHVAGMISAVIRVGLAAEIIVAREVGTVAKSLVTSFVYRNGLFNNDPRKEPDTGAPSTRPACSTQNGSAKNILGASVTCGDVSGAAGEESHRLPAQFTSTRGLLALPILSRSAIH